ELRLERECNRAAKAVGGGLQGEADRFAPGKGLPQPGSRLVEVALPGRNVGRVGPVSFAKQRVRHPRRALELVPRQRFSVHRERDRLSYLASREDRVFVVEEEVRDARAG